MNEDKLPYWCLWLHTCTSANTANAFILSLRKSDEGKNIVCLTAVGTLSLFYIKNDLFFIDEIPYPPNRCNFPYTPVTASRASPFVLFNGKNDNQKMFRLDVSAKTVAKQMNVEKCINLKFEYSSSATETTDGDSCRRRKVFIFCP